MVRRGVEQFACWSGFPDLLTRRFHGRGVILAFHNILPRGEKPWGERSAHLPSVRFRQQIEVLTRYCRIVALTELLNERPAEDRISVAITFDDAYRGAMREILRVLDPQDIPATVFVAPGALGVSGFWWDRLGHSMEGRLPGKVREASLDALAGDQSAVLEWATKRGIELPEAPEYAQPVTVPELRELAAASRHLTFDSHSWSHRNLTRLSDREVLDDLIKAKSWLADQGLGKADALAFPYGLASHRVRRLAREAGHRAGLMVRGGWLPADPANAQPFSVPRMTIPAGLTPEGLRLRLSGFGGA